MDFFSAAADPAMHAVSLPTDDEHSPEVNTFAQAIAHRFGHAAMLTARLTPTSLPAPPAEPVSPMANMSLTPRPRPAAPTPPPALSFSAVAPSELDVWLADNTCLVVDIRPHAAHTSARIPRAISLSVPSTLLKRPLFSLQKLSAMLPSASARNRFATWRSASRILVYDADSASVGDSSNINGLLRKFKSDGFEGDLAWLQGGFQAVWKDRHDIVDTNPPTPDTDNEEDDDDNDKPSTAQPGILRTRHLPMSAFSLQSTTIHNSPLFTKRLQPPSGLVKSPSKPMSGNSVHASNPFFDAIRQNTELTHGITERIPLLLPQRVRRRIHELPFPWLQHIARRAGNTPPRSKTLSDSSSSESESTDDGANPTAIEEGKEALAMQFYKVELAEQRRLMGVMEHHSRESGQVITDESAIPFPFSITAGVEKGAKNRYRHIWPFEHARVRLHQKKNSDDDYVNASYVQPLGTNRRYIATQGPLPATFTDFWTLCWEQNVHVIVMLTREVEGAMVKCGSYWTDTEFGPLRLRLVTTEGLAPPEERGPHTAHPGFFNTTQSSSSTTRPPAKRFPHSAGGYRSHQYRTKRSETVKRTFELIHTGYPSAKPRKIVHLQYLEWPDMNVPDDARGVLGLMKQVEEAVKETQDVEQHAQVKRRKGPVSVTEVDRKTGIAKHALGPNSPVLLHCSAGVGRTGGFIVVDAVLDAIRREIRSNFKALAAQKAADDAMDVDPVEGPPMSNSLPIMGLGPSNIRDLLVNAPLATEMQVDKVDKANLAQNDREQRDKTISRKFSANAGTIRWAENVREKTGIDGNRAQHESDSSSRAASTPEATQSNDSYIHESHSSLATSVSGASSSQSPFPLMDPRLSDLLSPILNKSTVAEQHRLRTVSAPPSAADTRSQPLTPVVRSLPLSDSMEVHSSQATAPSTSTSNGQSSSSNNTRTQPVKSLPHVMSSEGEAPSRSESPSDETSSSNAASRSKRPVLHLNHPLSVPTPSLSSSSKVPSLVSNPNRPSQIYDHKEPRPLHEPYTPPPVSSFEDPIWEVVLDMREQRMSLCQSLRQYVFVHAAIIEGALMVLDEEKEIAEGLGPRNVMNNIYGQQLSISTPDTATSVLPNSATTLGSAVSSMGRFGSGRQSPSPSRQARSRSNSSRRYVPYKSSFEAMGSSSYGKRSSSPTELLKKDKEGDVMLSKRPSIKRKDRSADEHGTKEQVSRYHPVPNRVASSVLHAGGVSAPSESSSRELPP